MRRRARTDIRNMAPLGSDLELAVVPLPVLREVLNRASNMLPAPVYASIEAPGGGGDARSFRVSRIRQEVEARERGLQ